jgi:glyoxylase-like metal-dependent hydrolase (beta-lactamase superfamily II)
MIKIKNYDDVIRFDIARTVFGKGHYWTAAYFIDGLLIDSGCAHTAKELENALKDNDLNFIVNTHSHEDHFGGNIVIQKQRKDLKILAHPLALPIMANPYKYKSLNPLPPYRKLFWGFPYASNAEPLYEGELIETEKYSFRTVYTPGHSIDHICLYEEKKGWLFTGDLFIGGKDRALRHDYDIWGIIASLKKIKKLSITKLFPGSARVKDNPLKELNAKISYLEETGEKVLKLHKKGFKTRKIAIKVFGMPMPIEFFTLGDFSGTNLVLSYIRNAKII